MALDNETLAGLVVWAISLEIRQQTKTIVNALTRQSQEIHQMAGELDALNAEVAQNTDVTNSAITLLNGLSQQLKDALAAGDPAAIQAVVDQLDANTQSLADAVTANTPAAPLANP